MIGKPRSKYFYLLIGFLASFIISLVGKFFEVFNQNKDIIHTLGDHHNYITPILLGIIGAIIGYFYWINKIQKYETTLIYLKNQEALLDINRAFTSSIHLETVLQIIIDKSTYFANLDTGAIYLVDNNTLFMGATTPPLPENFPEVFRKDELQNHPHIEKALKTGQPFILEDTSKAVLTESEQAIVNTRGLRTILYIPLIIEQKPVGVLIHGTINKIRRFSDLEIDMYRSFSGQAALAIENSKLYKQSLIYSDELKQQNEEFLSLNEELAENNQRINQMNEELKNAVEKAQEGDRLKSAFLQNMSHEVRTPLNAIAGFVQLISQPGLHPEKINVFSQMITRSCEKLVDVISDVIEISQIKSGLVKVKNSQLELCSFLQNILNKFRIQANEKNIKLILNNPSTVPECTFYTDSAKLKKIISHLLDNAIKFTFGGTIELDCNYSENSIQISVKDTGIGIPIEMHGLIFEPFRQVETGIRRDFGGNGLGLAIVKAYTELMEGSVSLSSELSKGSVFTVRIPVHSKEYPPAAREKAINPVPLKSILVAEDEYSNYLLLKEYLCEFDGRILHAENGKIAVEKIKTDSNISLVIMDIKMPVMDGHTAAGIIKGIRPQLPVIAFTAYALENEIEHFADNFDDYLTKPVEQSDFLEKIKQYIA